MLDTSKITTEQYVLGAIAGFLLLFAIGTCADGLVGKDPQTLANKAVSAIAKKDRAAIDKLLISPAQQREMVNNSTLPEEIKAEALANLDKGEADVKMQLDLRWESLYSRMSLDGFDHTKMKVVSVDAKEETREGIVGAEVKVDVESAGKPGLILLTAIKVKNWVMAPRIFFESKTGMEMH